MNMVHYRNRARLMLEITDAVCSVWGADRVGLRLSPLNPFNDIRDSNPEATFSYVVEQLNRFGLAYLHITAMVRSTGRCRSGLRSAQAAHAFKGTYMVNAATTRHAPTQRSPLVMRSGRVWRTVYRNPTCQNACAGCATE